MIDKEETYLEKLKRIREEAVMHDTEIIPIYRRLYNNALGILGYAYDELSKQAEDPNVVTAQVEFECLIVSKSEVRGYLMSALNSISSEQTIESLRRTCDAISSQYNIRIILLEPKEYERIFERNKDKGNNNCISLNLNRYSKTHGVFICEETLNQLATNEGIAYSDSTRIKLSAELPPYTFETKLKLMQKNNM